jgi:hypothetical protein
MEIKTDYGYQCCFCKREYKEKFNYDRHKVCCEFLCKSRREQLNDIDSVEKIPTQKEMFLLIKELALRNEKLEKEITKLKQVQKQKINILEWLNSPNSSKSNPKIYFMDWILKVVFPEIPNILETVYQTNLSTGLIKLFQNILNRDELNSLPIRAYENKPNTFYIFQEKTDGFEWKILSNDEFNKILSRICHQFIVQFKNNWFIPNQEKVENDENYKDMYINYYQSILGGNERISDDSRIQKTKQFIYSIIKQNIKTIVEYDFI